MAEADRCLVAALALGLDASLGDPENRWHPVAWMGSLIGRLKAFAPAGNAGRFCFGGLVALGGAGTCYGMGTLLELGLDMLPAPLALSAKAYTLKMMLSARGLRLAAQEIETALRQEDLNEAQRLLHWHLVSRDTRDLAEHEVCAAAIESVAENTSDGVVGPLYSYLLGGLGAAYAYRFSNTVDSMWGYHDAEHEWLGKFPARWDDLLNLIPARLTALGLALSGRLSGKNVKNGLDTWRSDRTLTASPNAGHPMSMMAGLLQVELEKKDHYRLGAGQRQATPADLADSVRIMRRAVWLLLGLMSAAVIMAGFIKLAERKKIKPTR